MYSMTGRFVINRLGMTAESHDLVMHLRLKSCYIFDFLTHLKDKRNGSLDQGSRIADSSY